MTATSPPLNRPLRTEAQAEADIAADAALIASRAECDRDTREYVTRLLGLADRLHQQGTVNEHNNDPAAYKWGWEQKSNSFAIMVILEKHYPLTVAAYRAKEKAEMAWLDTMEGVGE